MLTNQVLHAMVRDYYFYQFDQLDNYHISDLTGRRKHHRRVRRRVADCHKAIDVYARCPLLQGKEIPYNVEIIQFP